MFIKAVKLYYCTEILLIFHLSKLHLITKLFDIIVKLQYSNNFDTNVGQVINFNDLYSVEENR